MLFFMNYKSKIPTLGIEFYTVHLQYCLPEIDNDIARKMFYLFRSQ